MKSYEVVKDPHSGSIRVFVREERRPVDPLAGASLRRLTLERRVRLASLKSLFVAFRCAWRERYSRSQSDGLLFMAAFVTFPVLCAVATALDAVIHDSDTNGLAALIPFGSSLAILLAAFVFLSFFRRARR